MTAWLVLEFILPRRYASVRALHRDLIFACGDPESRRCAENAKYCYTNSVYQPISMTVPEHAGVLEALGALGCTLISQKRIEPAVAKE